MLITRIDLFVFLIIDITEKFKKKISQSGTVKNCVFILLMGRNRKKAVRAHKTH